MRLSLISAVAAGAVALGGCAYGDFGVGLGYGDYGYGYSPYYGYGNSGYGYGPYGGYGAYPGYYGGFGYPFGWYDNFYYPGTGFYVYDSYRRPRLWTSRERSYWTSRQRTTTTTRTAVTTPNFSGFNHHTQQVQTREEQHHPRP